MEPWFDANAYGWMFAVAMALPGASTGILATRWSPRGKGRGPIMTSLYVQFAASGLLLLAAFIAMTVGQPRSVWSALAIPAIITVVVNGLTMPRVLRNYRQAEQRRATQS
jgi:peptidoglycan/LPS O-acetylase OafA/YrhL